MSDVIQLPVTERPVVAKKRPRVRPAEQQKNQREQEEQKRRTNVQRLSVLGDEDASVRQLEELLFGAEERLVEQLEVDEKENEEHQVT